MNNHGMNKIHEREMLISVEKAIAVLKTYPLTDKLIVEGCDCHVCIVLKRTPLPEESV